ncbi:hypothetical protein [Actinocrispum sp. NPDC049592]|uniref:hypothetical protein n=1 Tax=Actinocrispum sp. NPDC049592 TaxID=3154835 RepID=UPI00342CB8F9
MTNFLGIYLKDQLALGVAWRELARRSRGSNQDSELGRALELVSAEIAEDVDTFRTIMRRLGIRPDPVKVGMVMVAERIGRLKPNGRLASYSPLSRFEELEFLVMGLQGKKQLWGTLRDLAGLGTSLPDIDFDALIDRAEHQLRTLEPYRVRAGVEALELR